VGIGLRKPAAGKLTLDIEWADLCDPHEAGRIVGLQAMSSGQVDSQCLGGGCQIRGNYLNRGAVNAGRPRSQSTELKRSTLELTA
jgi:hypothetical protein